MPELSGRQFADVITAARDAAQEVRISHEYPSGLNQGRTTGGCWDAACVAKEEFTKRGVDSVVRMGVRLNDNDEYVESGPDYTHRYGPLQQEKRALPDMKYSREELDEDEGLREQYSGTHAWVERKDTGQIVDPTADQFSGFGPTVAAPGTPEHSRYYPIGEEY